jgi:hypothetical protein
MGPWVDISKSESGDSDHPDIRSPAPHLPRDLR